MFHSYISLPEGNISMNNDGIDEEEMTQPCEEVPTSAPCAVARNPEAHRMEVEWEYMGSIVESDSANGLVEGKSLPEALDCPSKYGAVQ